MVENDNKEAAGTELQKLVHTLPHSHPFTRKENSKSRKLLD
jgi:hypothetical protein